MIIWSNEAKNDLQEIYDYVYRFSPQNADMMVTKFVEIVDSLEFMPYKFLKEPFINKENIRFVPKWNFKIIYAVEDENIIILNIFSTRQNPEKLLHED